MTGTTSKHGLVSRKDHPLAASCHPRRHGSRGAVSIGRLALSLSIVTLALVCGVGQARAVLLDVPLYKQCNNAWRYDPLGTCGSSMCLIGCAVTSAAMVYAYYGGSLDPGELNTCLRNNGGYTGSCLSYISWNNACLPGGVSWSHRTDVYDAAAINAALASGHPVIARVTASFTDGHFVVITGNDGGQYQIRDPYGDYQTIADGTYTIEGLRFYNGTPPVVCECSDGDEQQEDCGDCGTTVRVCEGDCHWSPFTACEGPDPTGADATCIPEGGMGVCANGRRRCAAGWLTCQAQTATTEICDGLDNDCDGVVDNGTPETLGEGRPCDLECGEGLSQCVDGELICVSSGDDTCDGTNGNASGGCNCQSGGAPGSLPAVGLLLLLCLLDRIRRA